MLTATKCAHKFILAPPSGPTSEGKCDYCGEIRYFGNSLESCMKVEPGYGRAYHHTSQGEISEEVRELMGWRVLD